MKFLKLCGIPAMLFFLPVLACTFSTPEPTGGPGSIAPPETTPGAGSEMPPAATPTAGAGAIYGILWHEICEFTGGEAGEPSLLSGSGSILARSAGGEVVGAHGPSGSFDSYQNVPLDSQHGLPPFLQGSKPLIWEVKSELANRN